MTGLDIFALIVLSVLVLTVLWVLVFLARWPGKMRRRAVTIKPMPFALPVGMVLLATAEGQLAASGKAAQAVSVTTGPFFVRLKLDDPTIAAELTTGSAGISAI